MNASVGSQKAEAQFERTLAVAGPVTLDVSLRSGRIRVRRGEDGVVMVHGVIRAQPSIFSWIHPEDQVQRFAANPPLQQDGNAIQIGDVANRWLLHRAQLLVDVTVPAQTRVRALGDSGDICVEGIDGPVDCETDSGEIQVTAIRSRVSAASDSGAIHICGVAGPIDASNDSGDIEALEIAGGIDAHTDSGNIRLSQTVVAPVYANSDSGRIRMKLADGGGYTVKVRTDDGRVEIPALTQARTSRREIDGVINGGGSIVAIETDSGDVEIA